MGNINETLNGISSGNKEVKEVADLWRESFASGRNVSESSSGSLSQSRDYWTYWESHNRCGSVRNVIVYLRGGLGLPEKIACSVVLQRLHPIEVYGKFRVSAIVQSHVWFSESLWLISNATQSFVSGRAVITVGIEQCLIGEPVSLEDAGRHKNQCLYHVYILESSFTSRKQFRIQNDVLNVQQQVWSRVIGFCFFSLFLCLGNALP